MLDRSHYKSWKGDFFALFLDGSNLYYAGGGPYNAICDCWNTTDEIKVISMNDVLANKPADWRYYAKLPVPGLV